MGQSGIMVETDQQLSIFLTDLGWMGAVGNEGRVHRLLLGHSSLENVRIAVGKEAEEDSYRGPTVESDWNPDLRQRLQRYSQGEYVEFDDVPLALPRLTVFQESVVAATRTIGYGETVTYGELADLAGYPRAARAVGSVMSANLFPILIPCHRVVASGGKLGGYTAPQGPSLKQTLLTMEAEASQE